MTFFALPFSGAGHLQGAEGGAGPRQRARAQVRDVPEGDEEEVGGGGRAAAENGGGGGHLDEVVDRVPQVMEEQLALVDDAQGEAAIQRGRRRLGSRGELMPIGFDGHTKMYFKLYA